MTTIAQVAPDPILTARFSPEMRLLVACARKVSRPESPFEVDAAGVRWNILLELAESHGLVAPLRASFASGAPAPSEFRDALEERFRTGVQRGLALTAVLLELMECLTHAGLHPLPYKGPALSAQIFGDPALRAAVDLDILLPADEVLEGIRLLTERGFAPIRTYRPGIERQLLKYRAEIGLTRDSLLVELQWRLAPKYFSISLDVEGLLVRATRVVVAGVEVPALAPEDNIQVLCIHGAKHQWASLKWLLDVHLLVRKHPDVPWMSLLERAETQGTRRLLLLGLSLSENLLGTPLPREIQGAVAQDQEIVALRTEMMETMCVARDPGEAEHHRLMLRLRERRSDQALYIARLAWQPTEVEWDVFSLPRGLHFAYHGIRVVRVLAKALRLSS